MTAGWLFVPWGCHTCGRLDYGLTTRQARRRSMRHERAAHGFSLYDPPPEPRCPVCGELVAEATWNATGGVVAPCEHPITAEQGNTLGRVFDELRRREVHPTT